MAPHNAFSRPARRPRLVPARAAALPSPGDGSGAGKFFDSLCEKAHGLGLTSGKVGALAKRAMGHQADALDVVDKMMGKTGVDASVVERVHALLEAVDLEALVFDGDAARVRVVELEALLVRKAGGGAEVGKDVLARFVQMLDTEGDGRASKAELLAATKKFGIVAAALRGAQELVREEET